VPGPVPAGLPSELVRRRPDLVAAERRLAAAGALVDSADAALYPRVALTAGGGTASNHLSDLVDGDFGVWSIGAGLLQPIFQGGRLIAQADVARAEETEALEVWASAVLVAFAEVESALATEQPLRDQEAQLAAAVEASRRALQQGQDRYRQGVESLLTVLETQRRVLDNESRLVNVRRQRLDNRVDLHLALGGGFAPPTETAPPSTPPSTPPNDPRSSR
jgi:NodT family efflux transporter outer membrane factor (OMF) lipoprotein